MTQRDSKGRFTKRASSEPAMAAKPGDRAPLTSRKMHTEYAMAHAGWHWLIRVWEQGKGSGTFQANVSLADTNGAHQIFEDTGPWYESSEAYATEDDAVRAAEKLVLSAREVRPYSITLVRK